MPKVESEDQPSIVFESHHVIWDTILFGSAERYNLSIKIIMRVLTKYEEVSFKLINKDKSFLYLHEETLWALMIKNYEISMA